jgi:hypothetical protein
MAMKDPIVLLNTDLELGKYDEITSKICLLIDTCHEERLRIMEEEEALHAELEELLEKEKNLKSTLEKVARYKPQYPKRYKVTLVSL